MNPGSGRSPWRREWQPSQIFLPGEFHELRSLVATVPRVAKKSDMTELVILSLSLMGIQ